jgi:hypothetical protein
MFRSGVDFEEYGRSELDGYALSEVLFEPWIVVPAPNYADRLETVAHELTHYMAYQAMQNQPRWFAEGLASYFESARFDGDDSFEIGRVPASRFQSLRIFGWEPPSKLLAGSAPSEPRFYASSWLLVHYLMTVRSDEFANFQGNLARGLSDAAAWGQAFPQLSGAALDHAVQEYAQAGQYERYVFRFEPPEVQTSSRTMSRADEHALRALLRMTCFKCPDHLRGQWREDVQLALSSDPSNVRAIALTVTDESQNAELALSRARVLVRERPEDWLAWVTLGVAAMRAGKFAELAGQPGADPGLHAPRLAPSQPYALLMAAVSHAVRGEREPAIRVSAAAQRMQPTNGALLVARAELLAQLSACEQLREVAARVGQMAHSGLDEAARQRMRSYSANCRDPRALHSAAEQ